jgi:hypothetical protein
LIPVGAGHIVYLQISNTGFTLSMFLCVFPNLRAVA